MPVGIDGDSGDVSPASAHRNPVPWQRWHFTTLSPFLTRPLPSQFLHLAFFLTLGPFSLAMMISRVRFARRIAAEDDALSVYPRHEQWHSPIGKRRSRKTVLRGMNAASSTHVRRPDVSLLRPARSPRPAFF